MRARSQLEFMSTLRTTFARLCRTTRTDLGWSQRRLASAVGVSRSYIAMLETGRTDPSLAMAESIAITLGLELSLASRQPVLVGGPATRDAVHAWCSGYVHRRLEGHGWAVEREVEIVHARWHGWIDLLAFDPRTRTLLIIEVKSSIDDLGAIERQVGWYERSAWAAARRFGWRPARVVTLVVALATQAADATFHSLGSVLDRAFPVRARTMMQLVADPGLAVEGRAIALIDPASKRRDWLIPSRRDGRRSLAPYRTPADAPCHQS